MMNTFKNKYVLVDYTKISKDINKSNKKLNNDNGVNVGVGIRCFEGGIAHSTVSNIKNNFLRSADAQEFYKSCEQVDEPGVLNIAYGTTLCKIFGLELEDYILDAKKEETQVVKEEVHTDEIIAKLDELILAINKLGNIGMQNMAYLKEVVDITDNTSTICKQINDKWNKPGAYKPVIR